MSSWFIGDAQPLSLVGWAALVLRQPGPPAALELETQSPQDTPPLRVRVGLLVCVGNVCSGSLFQTRKRRRRDGHRLVRGLTGGAGLHPRLWALGEGPHCDLGPHWLRGFCSKPPSKAWGLEIWMLGTVGHSPHVGRTDRSPRRVSVFIDVTVRLGTGSLPPLGLVLWPQPVG